MAKHIKIGEPVNEAERWAFAFMEENLPSSYLIISNLEILSQSGQPMEVDALVVGEYALYIVDVKGYLGQLDVSMNSWLLDDKWVDNSLAKANYVSRVLAGRIKSRLSRGAHAPWCQGMVLATGHQGEHIDVQKAPVELCVYTPATIIMALTSADNVTSQFKNTISAQQRDHALEVVGKIGVMGARKNLVQDFVKSQKLASMGAIEIWEAQYTLGDWSDDWLLKIIQSAAADSPEHYAQLTGVLKDEFYRLQQLSGISGVPSCAPIINDGEQLVLPIKRPRGLPLSIFNIDQLDKEGLLNLIRRAVVSIQQIHSRGCTVGAISTNDIFVSVDGDLEFLEIRNNVLPREDLVHFKSLFLPLAQATELPAVNDWFDKGQGEGALEVLRLILTKQLAGEQVLDEEQVELVSGNIIANRYRLDSLLVDSGYGQLWKVRHLAGQFDCVLNIYFEASQHWDEASSQYAALMQLYHPSLERVFDIDVLPANDVYFISRAWLDGEPLAEVGRSTLPIQLTVWMKQLLTALQYLHVQGLNHKNITPANIICSEQHAVLVNFSCLPSELRISGDIRYTDSDVFDSGWSAQADIHSLLLSFYSLLIPEPDVVVITDIQSNILAAVFGEKAAQKMTEFLITKPQLDEGVDYLALFGLALESPLLTELPTEFSSQWGVSSGYMTFLVLDMLNDQRPRSRIQLVLNALRSRHIPGNKTNRGSMSSTVSRLKAAGIAEDFGKKVRLRGSFLKAWGKITKDEMRI